MQLCACINRTLCDQEAEEQAKSRPRENRREKKDIITNEDYSHRNLKFTSLSKSLRYTEYKDICYEISLENV